MKRASSTLRNYEMVSQLLYKPLVLTHTRCFESSLFFKRCYAKDSKHDSPFYHEEWPFSKNPSPYEVLNLSPGSFDATQLKQNYYKTAKIYHPDIASNRTLLDHKGDHLSHEIKSDRFKMLTDAYNLLRDSRKKALYDQFKIGWMDSQRLTNDPFRERANPDAAYTSQHNPNWNDHKYWSAGTWEDYQNVRDINDPALKEEKMKVLAVLVMLIIVSASIQGWFILENVEKDVLARTKIHDDCEIELSRVYANYGLDDSRISRIRRFLWFRTFGLYVEKGKLDSSAREDERLLEEILGEKLD